MSNCQCQSKPTNCCPPFNSEPWQDKEFTWNNKLFIKDHVTSFLHIPLNFGSKVRKNLKLINDAKAMPENPVFLSDEKSLWGLDMYIEVTKDISGAQMATISGTFLTKVFEGPYCHMHKWIKEMKQYVMSKGKTVKKFYFYYTTCPKCAKAYGKNYVVILAQVA
jgi:hypothetical protein